MEAFQRLTYEVQRDRENADKDREIQRLRLENVLLRSDRMLLPVNVPDKPSDRTADDLQAQMLALKQEIEQLQKRLEQ